MNRRNIGEIESIQKSVDVPEILPPGKVKGSGFKSRGRPYKERVFKEQATDVENLRTTAKTKKLVAESSKAIECSYADEKKKIDSAIQELEKERLTSYIALVNKRKSIVNFRKQKLNELEQNLTKHSQNVKNHIGQLKRKKVAEKSHFDRLYLLNEHLKKIEAQVKDVVVSRKVLLNKEKGLLIDSKKFFLDNKDELRYHGLDKTKKINEVLDRKTRILAETSHLLDNDLVSIFADKRVLEGITDAQLNKVYRTNLKLKELAKEHRTLLKKRQELKTEDFEFEQMLNEINNKRNALVVELQKIK